MMNHESNSFFQFSKHISTESDAASSAVLGKFYRDVSWIIYAKKADLDQDKSLCRLSYLL